MSVTASRNAAPLLAASAMLCISLSVAAANVEGQLDPAFGSGGRTTIGFGVQSGSLILPADSEARAMTVQADGKIVLAGNVDLGGGRTGIGLARLNADGSLDSGFGNAGERQFNFSNASVAANAVLVQPDGKIVVAGWYEADGSGNRQFLAVRFNADGVDTDFGFGLFGYYLVDFGSGSDVATSMARAADGSLYVAGYATVSTDLDFGVVKLTPGGVADTGFSQDGKVTVLFDLGGDHDDVANAVAVQSDGKILVAGSVRQATSENEFGLARLTPGGSLDPTFGTLTGTGKSVLSLHTAGTACYDNARSLALFELPFTMIYVGGTHCSLASNAQAAVAAFDGDGQPATVFNGSGAEYVDLYSGYNTQEASAMVLQQHGIFLPSVIIAGSGRSTPFNDNSDFLVARMDYDGALDGLFGDAGHQAVYFNAVGGGLGDDFVHAAAMSGEGYLILAGSRQRNSSGNTDFAIARLLVGDDLFGNGFEPQF